MNPRSLGNIFKKVLLGSLVLGCFFVSRNVSASDVFRVTEYNITTGFTGTTYNLTLNNPLSPDHFILIRGAESGNVIKSPTNSYVKISKLPLGANKSLPTTGSTTSVELKRYAVGSSSWVGVVTVVECLVDCTNNGFKTLDILDLSTPRYTNTTTRLQSGTTSSITPWTNINKVSIFGGGLGSGTNIEDSAANSGYYNAGWLRLYPTGTNTINWERYNSNNDGILSLATSTVYAIEWGSAWNVQRVAISGSNGASGSNTTAAYNTAKISSATRANTWVYGSGYSQAAALGNGSLGTIITLGNGVAQNTSETTVAMGSQISGAIKSFDIYVFSHPNLSVDYKFKTNSGGGSKTAAITTTSNPNTTCRMSTAYSSMNNNTNNYPAGIFSSRYSANTTITLQREYYPTGTSYNFATWAQGLNFKNIQYTPQPTLNQYKYKWRDDTKALNDNNGWLTTNYNENPPLITKNINYRIRFAISNTGESDTTAGKGLKIQYGSKTGGSCLSTTTWKDIPDASNIVMSDSTQYIDQDLTLPIFDNPEAYTFTSGRGMDTTNTSSQIALLNNGYTELEYSIKISSTILDGDYCLRLFNATDNKELSSYLNYPEMLVGSHLVQNYYRWYANNDLITPTISLAQENSESFINENDLARLRLNVQAKNEALTSKGFILQYSKMSINGPWKTVSNPSVGAKWWNNYYSKRQKINFGTSHSLLPSGLTVSFTMNTQIAQTSGDDIRVVFQKSTGENYELDRIADNWFSTSSNIQFRLMSDIAVNTNSSTTGDYYVYYGNPNAVNPPTNLNNIYAVYDDFSGGAIRSDWKTFDNDKVSGTSFSESNGTLNINSGGVDTWEATGVTPVDDYSTVYQDNIDGDFEATLRCISQDNVSPSENMGLMVKNDITKTQPNNGYFVNVDNINTAFLSAWDSNNNGYLDTLYSPTVTPTWPHCLRIKKQGTVFTATYSIDCINFSAMNSVTIANASNVQDVGIYVLSNGGDILSVGKFNYFKLIKLVSVGPTTSLNTVETKEDWEFYDSVNINQSAIISQMLLSNSNVGELYSEVNPIDLNPNIIQVDQSGEYDFPLNSKNAEKSTYYFKLIRAEGSDFEEYLNYAKLTIGNSLTQNSYRWYSNTNAIDPVTAIANENQVGLSDSKNNPLRLRINIKNNLSELKASSTSFVLQYSKSLVGPWNGVGLNQEWEFYDNNLVNSDSVIGNTLLSTSTKKESYSEQNPTINNINNLLNNDVGEYDFSLIPKNATGNNYYFRLVKSTGEVLDNYTNYPMVSVNTSPYYNLASYKLFKNTDSSDVGNGIAEQNIAGSIEPLSDFRLRLLMSVSKNKILQNEGFFKLQFAEKGTGTCSNPQYPYSVLTRTTAIALKDNPSVSSGVALTSNLSDPYEIGATIKNQTYNEIGDFSNSMSDLNIGEYGKWDFALFDNNAGVGKTFCFKVVNVDGTDIQTYSNYPEVSIVSGVLSIDIVDNNGNSITNPIFSLDPRTFSYSSSSSQGIFGFDNQKIRITNSTANPLWTVSLSASYGETAFWSDGTDSYDFNDPTPDAKDGPDPDTIGGQMSIDPSFASITPKPGGTSTGIVLSSPSSFIEGTQNSLTIASSSSATQTNSYWDIMGVSILQSIPASQRSGEYSINMTLTVIGN